MPDFVSLSRQKHVNCILIWATDLKQSKKGKKMESRESWSPWKYSKRSVNTCENGVIIVPSQR